MKKGILYVRVSTKEQKEGYSLDAQEKLGKEYAKKKGIEIVKTWKVYESAWREERQAFSEMINFAQRDKEVTEIIFDMVDRMTRNDLDKARILTLVKKYGKTIHFSRTGRVFDKNSTSDDEFMLDIEVAFAKKWSSVISEKTKMGQREKAERGIFPGLAPIGYKNNPFTGGIDVDEERAPLIKKMFELYATGNYSLLELTDIINKQGLRDRKGDKIHKSCIFRVLQNSFYYGEFKWNGKLYTGIHKPLISRELFERVQKILKRFGKPKYTKHKFPFRGLLKCGKCGCTITAERKKGKYVYYHCTGYKGNCGNIRIREEALDAKFLELIKRVRIDEGIADWVSEVINRKWSKEIEYRQKKIQTLYSQLSLVKNRIRQAYEDKLDGKITEQFYNENVKTWEEEKKEIELEISRYERQNENVIFDSKFILELLKNIDWLYSKQDYLEKRNLLRFLLSNCTFDRGNLYPVYKKPFDILTNFQVCSKRGRF